MKICLICFDCGEVLIDRFSCPECSIFTDDTAFLEMECPECDKIVEIEIATKILHF